MANTPTSSPALGRRLAARRRACALTQERLAARAGLTISTVRRLERGTFDPHLSTLEALAAALGLPLAALLGDGEWGLAVGTPGDGDGGLAVGTEPSVSATTPTSKTPTPNP